MSYKIGIGIAGLIIAAVSCGSQFRHGQKGPNGSDGAGPQNPANPISQNNGQNNGQGGSSDYSQAPASGTITSGGGYIYGFESNPWFLGNVATVKYCIDLDQEHFGTTRAQAAASVERAIGNWKRAFARATFSSNREEPVGTLVVGTQTFELVDCQVEGIDIRFQFGHLTADQALKVQSPKSFVAVTVQEHYEVEAMKGRGFIYVSPESGPLRPDADDLAERFWGFKDQLLLDAVLMHELGHVFGIPHTSDDLMSGTFCESMVTMATLRNMEEFEKNIGLMSVYFGVDSVQGFFQKMMNDFFAVDSVGLMTATERFNQIYKSEGLDPVKENMLRLVFEDRQFKFTTLKVEVTEGQPTGWKKVRDISIPVEHIDVSPIDGGVISMRIPKNQKIMKLPADRQSDSNSPTANYFSLPLIDLAFLEVSAEIKASPDAGVLTVIRAQPGYMGNYWYGKWKAWKDHKFQVLN